MIYWKKHLATEMTTPHVYNALLAILDKVLEGKCPKKNIF